MVQKNLQGKNIKKNNLLLLLIIFIGSILRLVSLGKYSFWPDELASFQRAHLSLSGLIKALKGNQPLYETLMHFWVKIGSSDAFFRLPSAIFGILSLYFLFLLGKEIFNKRTSYIATIFLALSPLHLLFSRIARVYSLLTLLVVLSIYFLWKWSRKNKLSYGIGFVFFTALSLYAHFSAYLIFLAEFLWILYYGMKEKLSLRDWSKNLLLFLIIFLLVLPWFYYSAREVARFSSTPYYSSQGGKLLKLLFLPYSFIAGLTLNPFHLYLTIPAAIASLYLFLLGVKDAKTLILFAFFIPFIGGWKIPAVSPKHVIYLLPPFYLVISWGVCKKGVGKLKILILALLLPAVMLSLFNYFQGKDFADASMVTPWKEIGKTIEVREEKGEIILIESDIKFPYGMRVKLFQRYYKGKLPVKVLDYTWNPQKIREISQGFERVWVLLYDEGEPEKFRKFMSKEGKILFFKGFQWETHTLKGLKEGWKSRNKYSSYLYELYLWKK